MGKKSIELRVTFEAVYKSDGEYIPTDEVTATQEVVLQIPGMESKYVVLPKVLEGVTDRVITELNAMVSDYYRKQAEEERRQAELSLRPSFWGNGAAKTEVGTDQ